MSRPLVIATFIAALALPALAPAQTGPGGTIGGQGSAEIKRQPQFLRVQIEVPAKGKDIKEALAKLKDRREVIKLQLRKLDAAPETVAFGETTLGGEKTNQQKQMEMMIAQRLRSVGKTPDKAKPQPTVVTFTLKFDVPLKANDAEELLIVAQQLHAKIKEADLAGLKEYEKLTPQEEELADEAKLDGMMGQEEVKPGEPTFFFVGKLTEADIAKAMAEAFSRAKEQASRLAAAADVALGPLQHLELHNQAGMDEEAMYGRYNQAYAMRLQMANAVTQAREAVNVRPGPVSYRVGISAHFQVKAK